MDISSTKYNVRKNSLLKTIICEAPKTLEGLFDSEGQSNHITKKGTREDSWGVTQINLPSHPQVSLENAQNASWSIDWMARQFSLGKASMWTCYRDLKALGKI